MKNSADRERWITPSSICRILHVQGKPNSIIIVFLLIQNISKFKKSKLMLETRSLRLEARTLRVSGCEDRGVSSFDHRGSKKLGFPKE